MKDFKDFYSKKDNYYGDKPSDGLVAAVEKYNIKGSKAMDIGAGEGRNTFYLADLGFKVDAIEPTTAGMVKIVNKHHKKVTVYNGTFLNYDYFGNYDFIVAATSLDHMTQDDVKKSIDIIKDNLNVGGMVYIVVFTEDDPGFLGDPNASESIGHIKHYFKKGELLSYFEDFEILEYNEYTKLDETHGPAHFHGKAKLIARKLK